MAVESRNSSAVNGVDIYHLPEGCIANVLSLTCPRDASRLSLVASVFRSAAESDAVWDRFLPPDYRDIISRSSDGPDSIMFGSKKELYLYLCDHPFLIDGCTKVIYTWWIIWYIWFFIFIFLVRHSVIYYVFFILISLELIIFNLEFFVRCLRIRKMWFFLYGIFRNEVHSFSDR